MKLEKFRLSLLWPVLRDSFAIQFWTKSCSIFKITIFHFMSQTNEPSPRESAHSYLWHLSKGTFTNAYVVRDSYNLFSKHCLLQCLFMNVFPYMDIGHTQKTAHISKRQTMKYSNLSANVEKMWIDLQMMRKVRRKKLNNIDLSTPSQYFNANACLEYSITIPHFFALVSLYPSCMLAVLSVYMIRLWCDYRPNAICHTIAI